MNKVNYIDLNKVLWFQEGPGVRNTQYTNKGVKLLNVANLVDGIVDLSTSERYISEEEAYGKYKHFLCDEGDFIIASSGVKVDYIDKKMGFVTKDMLPLCMNTSTIRFKVLDKDVLNIKYFMYYLKSNHYKNQLSKYITGSAQLNYGPSHLNKMKMPIIALDQQNNLVERLSKIESILKNYKNKIIKLDELVKARFVEMFEDEDLPIGKISDIALDKVNSAKKDFNQNDQIKYVDISSIDNSNNSMTGYTEYILKDAPSRAQQHIKKDDVLVSTVRPNLRNVAINTIDEDNLIASSGFCVLRAKDNCLPYYLLSIVCSDKFTNKMTELTTGANYPAIHNSDVMNYEIKIPTIEKQKEFSMFAKQIDKSKFVIQKQIDETQKLFDSLMQEYFG